MIETFTNPKLRKSHLSLCWDEELSAERVKAALKAHQYDYQVAPVAPTLALKAMVCTRIIMSTQMKEVAAQE